MSVTEGGPSARLFSLLSSTKYGHVRMLKSLRVQHFRSLSDVHIDLDGLTLLVGPNSSGKSNLVDALRFLRDSAEIGVDHAVSSRGGIDVIRQFSRTRPYTLNFEITFELPMTPGELQGNPLFRNPFGSYSLRIDSKGGDFVVTEEKGSWEIDDFRQEGDELHHIGTRRANFERNRDGIIFIDGTKHVYRVQENQLAIGYFIDPHIPSFSVGEQILSGQRFAAIYPNMLRTPSRSDTESRLKEDCSNWASIIRAMRQRETTKGNIDRVIDYMRHVVPGLQGVSVKNVGGYLVPQFLVRESEGSPSHYFDPIQLSDGTLRLFAIFLALYQQPSPSFLALEEPEQTVHPGLLDLLSDAFTEVSETTQLLITTHSPYMLDRVPLTSIRVVTMHEGETRISTPRKTQLEAVSKRLMSLSEIMQLDGLMPEPN